MQNRKLINFSFWTQLLKRNISRFVDLDFDPEFIKF